MLGSFKDAISQMGVNTDEQAVLPDSEGGFSFIAPLWTAHAVSFMVEGLEVNDDGTLKIDQEIAPWFFSVINDQWMKLYYKPTAEGKKIAEEARKYFGLQYPAQSIWYVLLKRDEVINLSDEARAKFASPDITAECRVPTLASKKYRHGFHGICLPLAISAVARCFRPELEIGADIDLEFDVSEFEGLSATVTDDFYKRMCGDPDDRSGHLGSEMWARRTALWSALGENDPTKYQPIDGGKFATDSKILSNILSFLSGTWEDAIWGRFAWLGDPRPDATREKDGKVRRNQLPGLMELYQDEAEARAAAGLEGDEQVVSQSVQSTVVDGEQSLPVSWEGMRGEWIAWFSDAIKKVEGKPLPIKIKAIAKEGGITSGEAKIWIEYTKNDIPF